MPVRGLGVPTEHCLTRAVSLFIAVLFCTISRAMVQNCCGRAIVALSTLHGLCGECLAHHIS